MFGSLRRERVIARDDGLLQRQIAKGSSYNELFSATLMARRAMLIQNSEPESESGEKETVASAAAGQDQP